MNQEEAEYLISALKELLSKTIEIPINGEKTTYDAVEINNIRNKFEIIIRRANIKNDKCTFLVLTKDTKTCLMRLDTGDTLRHKNPNGQIIHGTHLHTFKEGYESSYAIPFDIKNPNLVQYCIEFLKSINIINVEDISVIEKMTLFS